MFAQKQYFDSLNRNQYLAKVKLMDEFFARFNGDEVRPNLTKKYADRKSNILFLFDLSQKQTKILSLRKSLQKRLLIAIIV